MKHTKSPWKVSEVRTANEYGTQGIDITAHNYRDFATVWNMEGMEDENEANAKLIATAPELLENLIRCVDRLEENGMGDMSAVRRAKEAIKKATE